MHKAAKDIDSTVTWADVKTQAYAKFFAEEFSQRFPQEPVQFLDAWAIELPKWPIAKHATMELFVSGVFQKYTSNNGFISPEASLAETLCHFSWCHSGGQMMVTDLQGFGSRVFTDPQIHCVKKDFFSRGNLGKDGMDQFFLGHCCNEICRALQLKASPIQLGCDTETASVISDIISDSCASSQRSLVCEYCSGFVSLRNQAYLDIIDEYQAIVCCFCKEKLGFEKAGVLVASPRPVTISWEFSIDLFQQSLANLVALPLFQGFCNNINSNQPRFLLPSQDLKRMSCKESGREQYENSMHDL